MEVMRITKQGAPGQIAGGLAKLARRGERVELRAMGPDAVYVAIKALVFANRYLANTGLVLAATPEFVTVEEDGQEKTVTRIIVRALPVDEEGAGERGAQ